MLNTLVSIVNKYMGSQWALFMPSVVVVYEHNEALVYTDFEWRISYKFGPTCQKHVRMVDESLFQTF